MPSFNKSSLTFRSTKIPAFELEDLVGRTVFVRSSRDGNTELITAIDLMTREVFVLKEIIHTDKD
jgi:hypothetical protein